MQLTDAESPTKASADRVRRFMPLHLNEKNDKEINSNIQSYTNSNTAAFQHDN